MQSECCSLANQLYIATANAPLTDRFQEMLDMLMTGAAFGQPTTLWLTDGCLAALALMPPNEHLQQLADFGVTCVRSENAPSCGLNLKTLNAEALLALRADCKQVMVF